MVIIRLSQFVVKDIPVPDPEEGELGLGKFRYDGRVKTGLKPFFAYSIVTNAADYRTWPVGVNADNYVVTINIADDAPYEWGDESGGRGNRYIKWSIAPHSVAVPVKNDEGFVYKTTSATSVKTYEWNAYPTADSKGRCWQSLELGCTNVHYCTVSGHKAGDAGDHVFTCVLNNDTNSTINVTNFYWDESMPLADKRVTWHIAQADNAITAVVFTNIVGTSSWMSLNDWQEGTTNQTPKPTWTWQRVAEDYGKTGSLDKVKYEWRKEGGNYPGVLKALDEGFTFPTEAGRYQLRAVISRDMNHEPGNWVGAEKEIPFVIWRHPVKTFANYVDFTLTSSTGQGSNKPVQLHLKEPQHDSLGAINAGLPGFRYSDVHQGDGGYEVRFVAISNIALNAVAPTDKDNPYARDRLLPFHVDSWNPTATGESTVSVTVPNRANGQKYRMYWRLRNDVNCLKDLTDSSSVSDSSTFCRFGLVSQLRGVRADGSDDRVWVNWWSTAPWASARSKGLEDGRYWYEPPKEPYLNPTTVTNSYFGKLARLGFTGSSYIGSVQATYVAMPQQVTNVFPVALGPYEISFTMKDMKAGVGEYKGEHILYEGDRHVDIELVRDRPKPIDPTPSPGGDTTAANLRVLLANDDVRPADPGNSITNQSYDAVWWRHGTDELSSEIFTNILPGSTHEYTNAQGVALWKMEDVHLGNLVGTNENYRSLPWSPTASTNCVMILRNIGDEGGVRDPDDDIAGAEIRSPWYTNGVGTIYFDTVNAFVTNSSVASSFRLVVEVSTNAFDVMTPTQRSNAVWRVVTGLKVLKFDGAKFTSTSQTSSSQVDVCCTDKITGGNFTNRFFRVIAPVPDELKRQPLRFRIHRVTRLGAEDTSTNDDPRGYILVDNVIASWPTENVDLGTPGQYNPSRSGHDVLGWETAFSVNYPSAAESNLYARAHYTGDPDVVTSARIHWSWRYLDYQQTPETVLYLDPKNDFRSITPLPLDGTPGDIEYWYDLTAVTPFYQYCDYSGCGAADPLPETVHTENPKKGVTRRRSDTVTSKLPSHGNEWFVRLTEGASDYAAVRLIVATPTVDYLGRETNEVETIPCFLCGDHLRRGFLRTGSGRAGKVLRYRIEAERSTNPGATKQVTETLRWFGQDLPTAEDIPNSPVLTAGTADDWGRIYCDGATGHLLFQIDDRTLPPALTVTRADFCDFNGWSDAVSTNVPPIFKGSSVVDEKGGNAKASGSSSKTQRRVEEFDWLGVRNTPESKSGWHLNFGTYKIDTESYPGYKPFESGNAQGNWWAYNGQWVARHYRPTDDASRQHSGVAVQLFGLSGGRVEIPSFSGGVSTEGGQPRGLGTVSFRARAGQTIDFYDFCTSGTDSNMKNYTLLTRATFDLNRNQSFAGNASLSLVAFYSENHRQGIGCYEARWEQLKGEWDEDNKFFTGPDRKHQRLCLYRWMKNAATGNIEDKLLVAVTNTTFAIPETSGRKGNYLPFFISAHTDSADTTTVMAGVLKKDGGLSPTAEMGALPTKENKWLTVRYVDSAAGHPKGGTYGVLAANCEGVFMRPTKYESHATASGEAVTFNGEEYECRDDLYWTWAIDGQRTMDFYDSDPQLWGIYAPKPSTKLNLYLGDANGTNWKFFGSKTVSGFGKPDEPGKEDHFTIQTVTDHTVRLEAELSPTDVVLTDVQFTQWRGDNFGTAWGTGDAAAFTQDAPDGGWGYRDSIVFTSGLIVDEAHAPGEEPGKPAHALRLSAKRTRADKPASVRSPYFDGGSDRGCGLGMLAFTYRNAQKNVNLLVQVATNGMRKGSSVLEETEQIREDGGGTWTTVTNFDFSACSEAERASGIRSVYLGLHGVVGMMRVVLDPKLVHNVQTNGVTDANLFGEIDIASFVVRDEPELTASDWWGWNVRTVKHDPLADNSVNDNWRTYLPDGDIDAKSSGLSIALNNRPDADVVEEDREVMREHVPFVQTPTFTNNVVGEVYFKARRYDHGDGNRAAEVTLYGSHPGIGADDSQWTELETFTISNLYWKTFTVQTPGSWSAFRFAVKGGNYPTNERPRVLLDEVMVFEAVRPTMGFRYVYPFRDGLEQTEACTNVVRVLPNGTVVPLIEAQPLCNESWTVQAAVEKRQLPEEIDMTAHPPRVLFHWFEGLEPWGYARWRDKTEAEGHHVAELALAEGEELVFRGSLVSAPGAVVPASLRSPTVMQYSADVVYRTVSGTELTNSLVVNASTAWVKPPWYEPVDYNRTKGRGKVASAYTILESIAPGRVWFNEVNVWDGANPTGGESPGNTNQFVEVAAPEMQSLEGWRVDYIDNNYATNTLFRFSSASTGFGFVSPTKNLEGIPAEKLSDYRTNDYVFLTAQSPKSAGSRAWNGVKGAIDGEWFDFDGGGGKLVGNRPIALRLIRPSQIVEEEIVVVGTNNATGRHQTLYSVTNYLANLIAAAPAGTSKYFIAGDEYANRRDQSLGVVRGTGATGDDWTSAMRKTPGRLNEGQIIPQGFVVYPNGELMIIRSQIGVGGHVLQAFGERASVTDDQLKPSELRLMLKKGGAGTNVTYKVANWWEIDSITTNGVAMSGWEGKGGVFTLPALGAGLSNDLTVVATARPRKELEERYGLTKANPYTPAVMAWLEGGRNYWDEEFENPGELHLAALKTAFTYTFVTNLDLTTMYWLDMDPTASNLVLRAGVVGIEPLARTKGEKSYTHLRLKLHMEMTNETTHAAWAPYVLRGLDPGVTTADYSGTWTSATFKVTGALVKDLKTMSTWVPLKWFTFKPDGSKANRSASFGYTEGGVEWPYRAKIDVWDPKDYDRAIWTKEWSNYPEAGLWFRWSIDDRGVPMEINPLRPDSTYIE